MTQKESLLRAKHSVQRARQTNLETKQALRKRLQKLEQEEKAEAMFLADLEKQVKEKAQNN